MWELEDANGNRYALPATLAPGQLHVGGAPQQRFVRGYGSDQWYAVLPGEREPQTLDLVGVLHTDRDEPAAQELLDVLSAAAESAARLYQLDHEGERVRYLPLNGALPVTASPDGVDGTLLSVTLPLVPASDAWVEADAPGPDPDPDPDPDPEPEPVEFGVLGVSSAGHDPVGSNHTVPLPAGEGGLLVVIAKGAGGAQLRWSTPAGWTKAASEGEGFTNWPVAVFTRVVDGTEPANLTFSTTNSLGTTPAVAGSALVAYRVAGAHGAVEAAFASLTNPPALTPSWGAAENLWIAAFTSRRSDGTFTAPPANYGDLTPVRSPTVSATNTHAQAATAHRIHATATEDPGPFAFTGSTNGLYTATIAVRPAAP